MPCRDAGSVDGRRPAGMYEPANSNHANLLTASLADGADRTLELLFDASVRHLRDFVLHGGRRSVGSIVRTSFRDPVARGHEGSDSNHCGYRDDAGMETANNPMGVGLADTCAGRSVLVFGEFYRVASYEADPEAWNSL